jgi:hypothetical protein
MRILALSIIAVIAFACLGIDVGESWRTGSITDGSAHAKRHHRKHHKRARHRHHKHHRAPATEM